MKIEDILNAIQDLAQSQGFYGRLLRDLLEIRDTDKERWQEIVDLLEAQNFKTTLDLVLYLEQ